MDDLSDEGDYEAVEEEEEEEDGIEEEEEEIAEDEGQQVPEGMFVYKTVAFCEIEVIVIVIYYD